MTLLITPMLFTGTTYPLEFNFGIYLATGETISGATVTAITWSGTDNSPTTILSGSAFISTPTVTQPVTSNANSEGTIYEVTCVVTTSASHVFSQATRVAFTAPAGQYAGNGT